MLQPDEVLRRAAAAATALESARYTLTGDVSFQGDGGTSQFHLALQGILRDAGRESQTTAHVTGTAALGGERSSVDSTIELLAASPTDVFVRMQSLALTPPHSLLSSEQFQSLIGRWWRVPAAEGQAPTPVTPDPSLLRAQAETVRVVKDHGVRNVSGGQAYVYDVTLDREKMLLFMQKSAETRGQPFKEDDARSFLESFDATGELQIDAATFVIRRVSWDIVPQSVSDKDFTASITVEFTDHGNAPSITPPKGAEPLSLETVLEALSGASIPPLPHG